MLKKLSYLTDPSSRISPDLHSVLSLLISCTRARNTQKRHKIKYVKISGVVNDDENRAEMQSNLDHSVNWTHTNKNCNTTKYKVIQNEGDLYYGKL